MHWPCLLQVGDSEVVQEEEEAEKQPGRIKKTYVFRFFSPGMGIVCENANFCSSETDFLCRKKKKKKLWGREIGGTKKSTK